MTDAMIFVRTGGALGRMVRASTVLAVAVAAAVLTPAAAGALRTVGVSVFPDGTAHVSVSVGADPLADGPLELDLMASEIDNFVAVGDGGFLLESEVSGSSARIDAFGSTSVDVEYDAHDLVSKQGRVWTFSADAPAGLQLQLPEGAAIVGMTGLPEGFDVEGGRTQVQLPGGPAEVSYIVALAPAPADPAPYYAGGAAAAAGAAAFALIRRRRAAAAEPVRDDDQDLIRFISENGGRALESDLRKRFLQPRTTMWRAVKRLERRGLVTVEKQDSQNLVRLRGGGRQ